MLFIPKIIYKAYVPNTNTGYISEKFFNDKILMVIHILRVIAHDQRSKHNHLYNSEYLSIMSSRSPMKSLKVVHCDIQQTLSFKEIQNLLDKAIPPTQHTLSLSSLPTAPKMCWEARHYYSCGHVKVQVNNPEIVYCTDARQYYQLPHENRPGK